MPGDPPPRVGPVEGTADSASAAAPPDRPERVIRWWGWADGRAREGDPEPGAYLKAFDVDAPRGRQWEFTADPAEALVFPTGREAFEAWTKQSTVEPLRSWDGRPNKPLTAFNPAIEPAPREALR